MEVFTWPTKNRDFKIGNEALPEWQKGAETQWNNKDTVDWSSSPSVFVAPQIILCCWLRTTAELSCSMTALSKFIRQKPLLRAARLWLHRAAEPGLDKKGAKNWVSWSFNRRRNYLPPPAPFSTLKALGCKCYGLMWRCTQISGASAYRADSFSLSTAKTLYSTHKRGEKRTTVSWKSKRRSFTERSKWLTWQWTKFIQQGKD